MCGASGSSPRFRRRRSLPAPSTGGAGSRRGMKPVSIDPVDVGSVPANGVEVDPPSGIEEHAIGLEGSALK